MATVAESYYQTPEQFSGKSLLDLSRAGQLQGRSDLIANILGVGENQALQSGQQLTARNFDTGSAEGQFLASAFKPGLTPSQQAVQPAVASLQASIPETQAAYAQKQKTLEGEKEPLKQRYQGLLDEISRRQTVDEQQTSTNLSREYGKRGIPLSSGAFDQALQTGLNPIRQYYTGQTKETGLAQEESLRTLLDRIAGLPTEQASATRDIQNAIAQLQAGAGKDEIQRQLQMQQLQQQQSEAEKDRQFKENLSNLSQKESDISKNYLTLGEGSTLYDLLGNKALYTAPKSYKSSGGASGLLDPLGLL